MIVTFHYFGSIYVCQKSRSNFGGTIAALLHTRIKAAISHRTAGYCRGGNSPTTSKRLNGNNDILFFHDRIRDQCPLSVKGLLSPIETQRC